MYRTAAADEPGCGRSDRGLRAVGSIVVLATIGVSLSMSSVTIAFAALAHDLDSAIATVQWVATGYLLGMAGIIATTGWLLRRLGARRLFLTSLGLFAATSVLCALASSIEQLVGFRVLQGIAGGATLPVGQMILASVAGPGRMAEVMSFMGFPLLLAPAFGPVVGGFLIDELSWHWLFLMNVPLAVAALALAYWRLPSVPAHPAGGFDWRGFALVVIGTPALVYGLAQAALTGTLLTRNAFGPALVGVVLLSAFTAHALRAPRPLLDLKLWRIAEFAACATAALLVSATLQGSMVLLPLYFQIAHGEPALVTGLLLMPQGLGAALSMAVAGRATQRFGGGPVAVAGVALVALTTAGLALTGPATPYWALCGLLALRGFGIGGSLMPAMASAYASLNPRQVSDATPQLNILQRIGGALGTALLAVVLTNSLQDAAIGQRIVGTAAGTTAFSEPFVWATALAVLTLAPATALLIIERRERRRRDDGDVASNVCPDSDLTTV